MTIAGRFSAALEDVTQPDLGGPELLPVRLARACARMLRVDGAGLSLCPNGTDWVPLGASSEAAALAERLQFTVGRGPCITAQETGQPLFAVEEDLRRRWPTFTDLLIGETPFRGVVALPLQLSLAGVGALDLYFEDHNRVAELEVFEAMAVGELVTSALSDAAVWSTWDAGSGPHWLRGPTTTRRAAVWEAMGKVALQLEIDVPEALALIRGRAYATGRTADDVAGELLAGQLSAPDLASGTELASRGAEGREAAPRRPPGP